MTTASTEPRAAKPPAWQFWGISALVLLCVWQIVAGSAIVAAFAAVVGAVLIARNRPRFEPSLGVRAVQTFLWVTVVLALFMILVLGGY